MKKALFAAIGLLAVGTAPALAADLGARPYTKAAPMVAAVGDWSGFYIGLNAGGASSRNCWNLTNFAGAPVTAASEGCQHATGAVAGGQIGYRWQVANWVFGLEAQGDWADLTGSNASTAVSTALLTNRTKVDAIGLFTGQVGYSWNTVLWYVKGGAAVTSNKFSGIVTATGLVADEASDTRWGAAIGTGVEIGFAPNWSVAVEYDHLFMGRDSVAFAATTLAVARTDAIRQGVDMGTVRVNYRFGGPAVTRY